MDNQNLRVVALEIVELYYSSTAQRWSVENTIDELKTHLNGRKTPIRSLNPREVVQEVYGWLLGHWAIRNTARLRKIEGKNRENVFAY